MANQSTVFLTPEETKRVTQKFEHGVEQAKARAGEAWKAENRQGLIQHATSTSLMQELSLASLGFGGAAQNKSDDTMMTYAIGATYPPCIADAADLQTMKVSELTVGNHHRGKKLVLHRISPVAELKTSSWAVMESVGEAPDQVVVVEMFLHKQVMLGRDYLDSGSYFIVKEPFYTLNGDNEAVIRLNHPSDLVIQAVSEDPESWRDNYTVENPAVTPEQCKAQGNAALGNKQLVLAHHYYSRGILAADAAADPASTLSQDIRRNRAHVNLLLQRYDEAKSDALESLTNGTSEEQKSLDAKAYYRAGSAAYALGQFAEAKKYFDEQDRLQPDNKTTQINVRRVAKRLEEQAKGNHDFNKVVASLRRTQGKADIAGFYGKTEVKASPGAGRGLFALRDYQPGELIMCEKAFCLVSSKDELAGKAGAAVTALTVDLDDEYKIRIFPAGLSRAVMQRALNNPTLAAAVLALDDGGYQGVVGEERGVATTAEGPVVDGFALHNIVQRNAFGTGPRSDDEDVSNATTGVWVRAAYLNHSCVGNSVKDIAGDLIVIRAARHIRAGEEITHAYEENPDYDARQAKLQWIWGFTCTCKLCQVEAEDSQEVLAKRSALIKEANEFVQSTNPNGARIVATTKAKRLRKALADTYDAKRFKGLPTLATNVIDHWLMVAQR